TAVAVGDQVTATEVGVGDRVAGLFLLRRVSRDEATEAAITHVDEARAVDAALGQAAPEVGGAEERAPLLDRVPFGPWLGEPCLGDSPQDMSQSVMSDPAWIVVRGPNPDPPVAGGLDGQRLAAKRLRDRLCPVVRLGADRRHLVGAHAHLPHAADRTGGTN